MVWEKESEMIKKSLYCSETIYRERKRETQLREEREREEKTKSLGETCAYAQTIDTYTQ